MSPIVKSSSWSSSSSSAEVKGFRFLRLSALEESFSSELFAVFCLWRARRAASWRRAREGGMFRGGGGGGGMEGGDRSAVAVEVEVVVEGPVM